MTLGHFIYIPGMILLGVIFGYILAGRVQSSASTREDVAGQQSAARRARARARAARTASEGQERGAAPSNPDGVA